ncbi:MAG: hypothetical protein E6K14_02385 [Methanobacteriota archaeon]|nr:MAG: hypothetical protein E6K14_02385 [Euryarchaeota archaeon]
MTPPRHNVYSTAASLIRPEVSRIPRSLQESLETLADDVLLELAQAHGVEAADTRGREKMIHALLGLPDSAGVAAEADRLRIESRLERLRPRQLRELGERHQVSLQGLKKKSELVEALAGSKDSSDILAELEAIPEKESGFLFGKETGPDVERVEALLEAARKRFQERRFEAALSAAHEASRIAERTTEPLRRTSWSYAILAAQALLEPCDPADPAAAEAVAVLNRSHEAFVRGSVGDDALLGDLVRAAGDAHAKEADRVRELLAQTRDAIREAANLGASVALAEDAWKQGADFLDRHRLASARESFVEAGRRAGDARSRRIEEVEGLVPAVADHIELARNVGADVREAEGLLDQARTAISAVEHGRAGDLLKRAERLAMKGQQRQIERAIQLRQSQVEKAQAIIAASEPVLKEAESYDLSAAEVRTLLRQARDVLGKGDYLAGLTLARNAEEAARHLEGQVDEERRRRGISKPVAGMCGVCSSRRVAFDDDGGGRCADCGSVFRWRGPLGVWERLRALLAP